MTKKLFQCAMLLLVCGLGVAGAAEDGTVVAVLYNARLPESKGLAEYYAGRRQIPTNQIFGFDLPTSETMTRAEFRDHLERPLLKALEHEKLFVFRSDLQPATAGKPGKVVRRLAESKIRYLTLCFGVPLKILTDPTLVEEGIEKLPPELRRNEAAVDSELALLPISELRPHLAGPLRNAFYNATNAVWLQPTNGLLMVARLDGPSVELARGLVDKAMEAETNGLWGRAYFDVRGLTNGPYKPGDDWIRGAAQFTRRAGFETVLDEKPETFSAGFPMSQIALYAGWYDGGVSGPFTRPVVEFMPGAVAYHLHSFSAATIRSPTANWVGPLLAKGATATMGCVEEPYLEGTPDVNSFFTRFLLGFSFGEAAYSAQASLSWQTTVVGDPLYRPFARPHQQLHAELAARSSKLIEWSHLKVIDLNLAMGTPEIEAINYLEKEPSVKPAARASAVLQEKLGDLYFSLGKVTEALEPYQRALQLDPTPQQRVRLTLQLARTLNVAGREEQSLGLYQQFVKTSPDYPDLVLVYHKLLPLARSLGKTAEADHYQAEIDRLAPPPPAAKP